MDSIFRITSIGDSKDPTLEDAESICKPLRSDKLYHNTKTIWVEHLGLEHHLRRLVRELVRETEGSLIESSFKGSVLGSLEADSPIEEIAIFEAH